MLIHLPENISQNYIQNLESFKSFEKDFKKDFRIQFQSCIQMPVKHLRQFFIKIVNGFEPLPIFTKSLILDYFQGSEYASEFSMGQNEILAKAGV